MRKRIIDYSTLTAISDTLISASIKSRQWDDPNDYLNPLSDSRIRSRCDFASGGDEVWGGVTWSLVDKVPR